MNYKKIIKKKISIEYNFNSGFWFLIHPKFIFKSKNKEKFKLKVLDELKEMSVIKKTCKDCIYSENYNNECKIKISINKRKICKRFLLI